MRAERDRPHRAGVPRGSRRRVPRGRRVDSVAPRRRCTYAPSGASRQASVASGSRSRRPRREILLVHDGARPLVTPRDRRRPRSRRSTADPLAAGAVVGQPAIDTLKIADGARHRRDARPLAVLGRADAADVSRARAARARTPLADATASSAPTTRRWSSTAGGRVLLVEGPRDNIKVTVAEDVALVEAALRVPRVGGGVSRCSHRARIRRPRVRRGPPARPRRRRDRARARAARPLRCRRARARAHGRDSRRDARRRHRQATSRTPIRPTPALDSLVLLARVGELARERGLRLRRRRLRRRARAPKISPHRDEMRAQPRARPRRAGRVRRREGDDHRAVWASRGAKRASRAHGRRAARV